MADWSMLPNDLLDAIALKLDSIEDLICFSAVCRSWNDVFIMVKRKWMPTTPWLLLAEQEHEHEHDHDHDHNHNHEHEHKVCSGCRKIFDIRKNKCLELNISQASRRRCWGSRYGWIVMIGGYDDKQVSLFNPITKGQLSLPSLESGLGECATKVRKAFVIKIDEDDFVVMVTNNHHQLSLARPGDKTWTKVITISGEKAHVLDVLSWKGLVLIMHSYRYLTCCDVSTIRNFSPSQPVYANKPYGLITFPLDIDGSSSICQDCYMVELAGDFLLVVRNKFTIWYRNFGLGHDEHEATPCFTRDFKVYKLSYLGEIRPKTRSDYRHVRILSNVKDLGDYMVFVSNNSAMSVHKSKLPNCQHNVIYFTGDEEQHMSMFDMASRKIKRFYPGNDTMSRVFAPTLFMPKF
ncbi:uncharacterized protein LOC110725409 [Chenopodium quinoa]|uniref:uncharacterized protein LOC110725409 n=1 Tax=Chenopodium quinoa TaxID=63459 RepID=UPI000B785685|nr:uncharacterized protein LOC110725409 [Chenopodium quinoa]